MSTHQKSAIVVSGLRTSDSPVTYVAYETGVQQGKHGVEFTENTTACWYFIPWHRVLEIRDTK